MDTVKFKSGLVLAIIKGKEVYLHPPHIVSVMDIEGGCSIETVNSEQPIRLSGVSASKVVEVLVIARRPWF